MAVESFGGVADEELPVGSVVMWAGALADIPTGWALCDGNNGTLNFLGRFVQGPPGATDLPGSTGGADSVTLSASQLPSHKHDGGETGSYGDHSHYFKRKSSNPYDDYSGSYNYNTVDEGTGLGMSNEGGHSHNISVGNSGSGNGIENRPSYYELAFIQKL